MQYIILSNYTPSYSHYVFYYHKVLSFQFHLVSNWPSQWQVFMVIYLTPLFWSPEQSEVFWRNSACLNRLLYIFYFRLTLNFNLSSPFLKLSHFLSHRRSHLVHLRDYDFGMLGQCKPERQTNPRKQQEMDAEDWTCQPFLGSSGTWRWDWKRSSGSEFQLIANISSTENLNEEETLCSLSHDRDFFKALQYTVYRTNLDKCVD